MICTITVLNVKTRKLESQTLKDNSVHPNKVLLELSTIIANINKKSDNLIVISVNVSFVDIIEQNIANNCNAIFKD